MVSIDPVTFAALVGTWVLVVGTLGFAYWQLRQTQRLHSASTVLDLRERFFGPRMQEARRELSTWLLRTDRGEEVDNWEVGIFFELLGSLTREGVLERRMVWEAFGTWVTAYYVFSREPVNLFERWRQESRDPLIFANFEWLAQQCQELDRRATHGAIPPRAATEDARDVLSGEARLAPAPRPA
ncbi:MAG TPA: hypothetical protein VMC82_01765 [Thermoplasmata archaeon]|nr:hypothetical protein [Thermoplasmata archaeon]